MKPSWQDVGGPSEHCISLVLQAKHSKKSVLTAITWGQPSGFFWGLRDAPRCILGLVDITTLYREVCLGTFAVCHSRTQGDSRGKIGTMIYSLSIKGIEIDTNEERGIRLSTACSPPMGPDKIKKQHQTNNHLKKKKFLHASLRRSNMILN